LDAHGTTYRHCGFDQPLSNNWRCQNRVAFRGPEPSTWAMLVMGSRGSTRTDADFRSGAIREIGPARKYASHDPKFAPNGERNGKGRD
jgi:hypothetical protein